MQKYIFQRILQGIVTLFLISVIAFILGRLSGDPVVLLLPETATEQDRTLLTKQLGLDKPLPEQYGIFILNALHGDMGNSLRGNRSPALELVFERAPATFKLAGLALVVTLILGLLLGVLSAVKKGSIVDVLVRIFALLGQSAPVFWIGIMAMYLFSVQLGLLPTSGYGGLKYYVLPVMAMGWFMVAAILRLTRSGMIEVLDSEYIKLARIKGLPERVVVWKHALRNCLIPIITYSGNVLGRTITGVVIIETVFTWPGIGTLAYNSIIQRDFPVVQAVVLFTSFIFVFINLVVDILYVYIDPRIRYT
jgi:peptide/nickel transport system permease protein